MYAHMNSGESGSGATQQNRYFVAGTYGNPNYRRFRNNFRTTNGKDDLNAISNVNANNYDARMARNAISSTINVAAGLTPDPTKGATNWAGGNNLPYVENNAIPGTAIFDVTQKTEAGYPSTNIFYQLGANHSSSPNTNVTNVNLTAAEPTSQSNYHGTITPFVSPE